MFIAPKILVIDDKRHHMTGLQSAFDELQASVRLLHYDAADIDKWRPISGVRLVFIDKNLTELVTTTGANNTPAFTAIIDALEKVIPASGGPYGLIIWAESPDLDEFKKFFDDRVDRSTFPCPAFCVAMTKTDFIDTSDGTVKDPKELQKAILEHIKANPQMGALLNWEAEVTAAMSDVLTDLFSLLPDTSLNVGPNQELNSLLHHLAVAGAGADKAREDPKHSAEIVLHALLSDRLDALNTSSDAESIWKSATDSPQGGDPSNDTIAAVNTALHLEYKETAKDADPRFDPTRLGALVTYPFKDVKKTLPELLGITFENLLSENITNLEPEDLQECRLLLAKIGAACDDAQPKVGPITYILALEWPYSNQDGSKTGGARRHRKKSWRNETVLISPEVLVGESKTPGKITFFLNLTLSIPRETASKWITIGRLRNEMSATLTQCYARHLSRPGLTKL